MYISLLSAWPLVRGGREWHSFSMCVYALNCLFSRQLFSSFFHFPSDLIRTFKHPVNNANLYVSRLDVTFDAFRVRIPTSLAFSRMLK